MHAWIVRLLIIFVVTVVPFTVFAAGGHDGLSCTGCHSLHKAQLETFILAVKPNTKDLNPKTNQPYTGTTAICLSCHQTPEKGGHGMTPISAHLSHPYGLSQINPKIAQVPAEFLSNGRFECTGCHDPHPSNPNRKYLRVDASGGSSMENFCAVCHPTKSDPKSLGSRTKPQAQDGKPEKASAEKKRS